AMSGAGVRACLGIAGVSRRAFTLLELIVVIVIIGVLTAAVVPRFASATDDARTAATESILASVRASIASHRATAALTGAAPFPTHAQLIAEGTVMSSAIPANPFSGVGGVASVSSSAAATSRQVSGTDAAGWNYFVDNSSTPPRAVFWANSGAVTTASDGSGGWRSASDL
ncbi:MAG: prepilin-type N-terminal cleavage/methylation domain-containing protein, partial [Planctomycetota bacterium]